MYLQDIFVQNSGALRQLSLRMPFLESGAPKPLVIVGKNGSGKTNFLSFITDALIELAAMKFTDVAPAHQRGGHQYFRVLGGRNITLGQPYELVVARLKHQDNQFVFFSKIGTVRKDDVIESLPEFAKPIDWDERNNVKFISGSDESVEEIFRNGVYASFPSSRAELPYWSNKLLENESGSFQDRFQNLLRKPISVSTSIPDLKTWLVDVLLDQLVDVAVAQNPAAYQQHLQQALRQTSLPNINTILQTILGEPLARIVRGGRESGNSKLQVYKEQSPLMLSLDSFSSGQATVFSIFANIVRYSDIGRPALSMDNMEGIVIVDEIDAHLHADMQYTVLPKLVKMFPRVQFVVTAHAPLFPLGMQREFGDDGFEIIELPQGTVISPERFSEFSSSFEKLKNTKAFEEAVQRRASSISRPLVLCEGETDPKYLRTSAELLGFDRITQHAHIDWIGVLDGNQSRDGGEGQLRNARKTLQNNPVFLVAHTLLLFDCDVKDNELDEGMLHVRVMKKNLANTLCSKGVENLLPETVFEQRFRTQTIHGSGLQETIKRGIDKTSLCNFLCDEKRDPADFEGFRETLEGIDTLLWPVSV